MNRPSGSASQRRAAVLGAPIAHSLSPVLHRAAYDALGLDWRYDAIEVDVAGLPGFIADLDESWVGLSLTMPLKESVGPLLDHVDPLATAVRAVNTVLPGPDGTWWGTNTDVDGIRQALRRAGLRADARTATVLGAGATARSAVAAVTEVGITSLVVCARRPAAADDVGALAADLGIADVRTAPLTPDASLLDVDLVVSTLPGAAAAPWVGATAAGRGTLLDASYHPWPTPLAAAWPTGSVASGRDMLLWQAVRQVELMTGRPAPWTQMAAALPVP